MKKFKTKAIQADEVIFTHILAYSDIFKHKQSIGIFRNPYNPGIFRSLIYIQNKKHILSRDILRIVAHSELWYIQSPGIFKTLSDIYYGAFSQKQSTAIIIFITSASQFFYFMKKYYFFNTGLICIAEVFIRCKVWGLREPWGGGREFLIDLFLEIFK